MRDFKRRLNNERPRMRLIRDAEGRLQPATADHNIGDIWAEQKRIRLAEAILADKKKAEKKQRRKEKFSNLVKKLERRKAPNTPRPAVPGSKEIVLNISVPRFRFPRLPTISLPKVGKKHLFAGGVILAAVALGTATTYLTQGSKPTGKPGKNTVAGVLSAKEPKGPSYKTVLPEGKSIGDLGGWRRVSPADKEPVFAFADEIDTVRVTVSEQPLPNSFKADTFGEITKLAKQFNANDKLAVADDAPAYAGTSIRGPQSVVVAKHDVLILIKADKKISTDNWITYINALQE